MTDAERHRLDEAETHHQPWYRWGPYLAERQWGQCARITRPLAQRGIPCRVPNRFRHHADALTNRRGAVVLADAHLFV